MKSDELIGLLELVHNKQVKLFKDKINENTIESLTNQLDNIFRKSKSLNSIDYQLFVCNIEILKIRYFSMNHQNTSKIKDNSFKAFVDLLDTK